MALRKYFLYIHLLTVDDGQRQHIMQVFVSTKQHTQTKSFYDKYFRFW